MVIVPEFGHSLGLVFSVSGGGCFVSGQRGPCLNFLFQASAEHLQQCAEFLPLRNRALGPLAVTVLRASSPVHSSSSF
jgi:hypothetical protein